MEPEDPDHAIEHQDRRHEHGARVQLQMGLDPAGGRVGERRLVADVSDRDRPALAGGHVGNCEVVRDRSDRSESGRRPLGGDRHRLARLAEPEEAAADAGRRAGRLDGDSQHVVEVELGAHLSADRRDEPFALERILECVGGARAVEGERRVSGQRLEQRQLVSGEDVMRRRRRDDEHRGHLLLEDQRDEDRALRVDLLGEAAVDLLGARDVVHDDRAAFEDRARDARRLAVEVDLDVRPPVEVSVGRHTEEAFGALRVLADHGDCRHVDAEQRETRVDQDPRNGLLSLGADELARKRGDPRQLLVGARSRLGLALRGHDGVRHVRSTVPAKQHY
jgi:hypothetical protein